jgi:hypothetical protein
MTDIADSGYGPVASFNEHSNNSQDSKKHEEFIS